MTRGYAAARLDDIAARAGVSKGTLYLYYAGKEELFKAVVRVKFVPIISEFQARVEQATGSSEQLLTEILESWWCCFSQPKLSGIIKLIISEAGNFPEIARFFNDEVSQIGRQTTRSLLERGIERNEFRAVEDIETASHLIISPMVMQLVWHHSVGACVGDCIDPDNFIRQHTRLVLMMLKKPGPDQS